MKLKSFFLTGKKYERQIEKMGNKVINSNWNVKIIENILKLNVDDISWVTAVKLEQARRRRIIFIADEPAS